VVESSSCMIDEALSICSISQFQQEWLLDFSASHNMSSHRNWFCSYQSIDDSVVFMGNDITCKSVGIESIKIKIFNGIVRMLMDVRHVRDLKKNFISLGIWDYEVTDL
jgi:hypothetical protein